MGERRWGRAEGVAEVFVCPEALAEVALRRDGGGDGDELLDAAVRVCAALDKHGRIRPGPRALDLGNTRQRAGDIALMLDLRLSLAEEPVALLVVDPVQRLGWAAVNSTLHLYEGGFSS